MEFNERFILEEIYNGSHLHTSNNSFIRKQIVIDKLGKLTLNLNKIIQIDTKAFINFNNLTELWLYNLKLETIDPRLFEFCTNLSRLGICNNEIKYLSKTTFEHCRLLSELWLNRNKLRRIHRDLFAKCASLTHLWLNNNCLEYVDPACFEQNKNLKCLYLYDNQLRYFYVERLNKLQEIELIREENLLDGTENKSYGILAFIDQVDEWIEFKTQNLFDDRIKVLVKNQRLLNHAALINFSFMIDLFTLNGLSMDLELDIFGNTPVHLACKNGCFEFLIRLLNSKLVDKKDWKEFLTRRNYFRKTPFDLALDNAHSKIAKYLLKYEFKHLSRSSGSNSAHNDWMAALMFQLIESSQIDILNFLLKLNNINDLFDLDEVREMSTGRTCLHLASALGLPHVVDLLCSYDSCTEVLDHMNRTPLDLALLGNSLETIKALIVRGANCEKAWRALKDKNNMSHFDEKFQMIERAYLKQTSCASGKDSRGTNSLNKIRNLVFQGGSVKCISYLGAMQVLLESKKVEMKEVVRLGGASAGAITASLLATGYNLNECEDILMNQMNLLELLDGSDDYKRKFLDLKEIIVSKNIDEIVEHFIKKLIQYKKQNTLVNAVLNLNWSELDERLWAKKGVFTGQKFRDFIDDLLRAKTGLRNTTFGQLDELVKKSPHLGFKHVYIVGVNLLTARTVKFSHRHTRETPIADAVRISMSIPILFEPFKCKFMNEEGYYEEGLFVDGGVLDNYPIWLFDNTKYLGTVDSNVGTYICNHETLGFRLVDRNQKTQLEQMVMSDTTGTTEMTYSDVLKKDSPFVRESEQQNEASINDFFTFLSLIVKTFMDKQDSDHFRQRDDRNRSIYIDTFSVGMLDFDLSFKQKIQLIESGRLASLQFCSKRNTLLNKTKSYLISPSLLALIVEASINPVLIQKNSKRLEIKSQFINKNSPIIAKLIYKFYANGTNDELDYLKSLNLKVSSAKDHSGNTALHLAALDKDFQCVERIRADLADTELHVIEKMQNNEGHVYSFYLKS